MKRWKVNILVQYPEGDTEGWLEVVEADTAEAAKRIADTLASEDAASWGGEIVEIDVEGEA